MYRIAKSFEFSSAHFLMDLPEGHQCARLHGHNYTVELELQARDLTEVGFVKDYNELKPFKDWLDETVDHQSLNDVCPMNPTAENLAYWFYTQALAVLDLPYDVHVVACRVKETPKTTAEYRP